jgi:SAM-dependent methyltransferase
MRVGLHSLSGEELAQAAATTLGDYENRATSFWEGTKDHDVSQNVEALLRHVRGAGPFSILDVGCGPGRDLMTFTRLGHRAVGLDGAAAFVAMAQRHSGCEVLHQNLLALELPPAAFDGVYANAVLFHVPAQELPRVLGQLHATLKPGGVFFASNPRGPDVEEWKGQRYGCYLCWPSWRDRVIDAGFEELEHYYRPPGLPRHEQPWLASVWRRPAA